MQKKYFTLLALLLIISQIISITSYAKNNECKSWYIKRNGNMCPTFPKDADKLSEYNCYFIDKRIQNTDKKQIYLTFDAGYENGNIEKILDTLKQYDVPAAFFILDNIILKNENLVKRMIEEGHIIGNHTKNHKNLSNSSKEAIKNDLEALERIYKDKTGREMSKFFRFPEGKYSLNAVKSVCDLGYTTIFWSFGYEDWDNDKQMSEEKAIKKILDNTHNGAVILLHPTSDTNAKILETLIIEWRKMGYSFGSLYDLTK